MNTHQEKAFILLDWYFTKVVFSQKCLTGSAGLTVLTGLPLHSGRRQNILERCLAQRQSLICISAFACQAWNYSRHLPPPLLEKHKFFKSISDVAWGFLFWKGTIFREPAVGMCSGMREAGLCKARTTVEKSGLVFPKGLAWEFRRVESPMPKKKYLVF